MRVRLISDTPVILSYQGPLLNCKTMILFLRWLFFTIMVICLKIFLHVMKRCTLQLSMQNTDSSSHIVRHVSLLLFIVTNHARFWVHKFSSNYDRENRCGSPTMTFFACVKYEDIFHYYLSIHASYQLISFAICAFSVFVRCYSEVPDAATLAETRPLHCDSALSIRERREEKFWFIQRMQHYE